MTAVDDLVRQGRHDEAAALAIHTGLLSQALDIYEKLWRFADAVPLALQLGQSARAVRLALEANMRERAIEIAASVPDDDVEGLSRVMDALAGRGLFDEAARIAERAGKIERAADLYRRSGMLIESARLLVSLGRLREAAELLELVTSRAAASTAPHTEVALLEQATAQLHLGRLLARLGRPLDAARILQASAQHPATTVDAHKSLCAVLLRLGYPDAANEVARRLATAHPELPASAEQIAGSMSQTASTNHAVPERFVVDRMIGGGATGRVYLAEDRLLGRKVALKALSVGATHAEEEALSQFLREAEVAGRLRHPHIVALLDVDTRAGLLVLEYLPGGSLRGLLDQQKRLSPASVRRLALELLDALGAAHAAGIIHRDVKPANIFLDAAGSAKLGDFGAAHVQDFGQTQTGGLIGTLAYLSPEQVTGGHIGPGADLYSLAATIFEALTGRPPFLGPDFVSQHLGEQPPPPSRLLPGLHARFDEVVTRALAKAPSERFTSAAAMAEAVRDWPVDDAVAHLGTQSAPGALDHPTDDPVTPPPLLIAAKEIPCGETRDGRLVIREDPRVQRPVLLEIRNRALNADERRIIQLRAAAGGPQVQRILALSADHREIAYEVIEGDPVNITNMHIPGNEARFLVATAERLACTPVRVVNTPAGFVLLLQPEILPEIPVDGSHPPDSR